MEPTRRKCDCSGPCGPQFPQYDVPSDDGLSRRDFITLAGATGAGALIPLDSLAATRRESASRAFEEWKAGLHKPTAPRSYRSDTHLDARMPMGGIGTGNFDLGVDGQLTTWQLFNTLRDGHVPLFFGVKCGKTAKMIQTRGGPDGIPRIKAIEMSGDYPMATLRYQDSEVPVRVEMTAFSPFEPLNTRLSSMPLACFVFKIHNPTKKNVTVSLSAFMQNPVGYDALGVPISFNSVGFNSVGERLTPYHPNFGGNRNEIRGLGDVAALLMSAEPGGDIKLEAPVAIYTNLNPAAFRTTYDGLPPTLSIEGLDRISFNRQPSTFKRIIWLENAPVDLPPAALRAAAEAVKQGARLVFAGTDQPLLKLYGEVTQGKPFDNSMYRPDIVFEDFENGYGGWTVEGNAFGTKPAPGTLQGQQEVAGFAGKALVNSYLGGDSPVGKLTSKKFTIERNFIRFLVGGGRHADTQVRLVVEGKVVRARSGKDSEKLEPALWDVRELKGKSAHIEIVDNNTGGWGHVNVDNILFADLPGSAESLEILASILPASFTGIRPLGGRGPNTVELVASSPHPDARQREMGTHLSLLSRRIDSGVVEIAMGPLLPGGEVELVGARREAIRGLLLIAEAQFQMGLGVPARAPGFGTLALGVIGGSKHGTAYAGDWQEAWRSFVGGGAGHGNLFGPSPAGETINGAIGASVGVPPGKTVEVPFLLAWHYPNHYSREGLNIGNHYTTLWPNAQAVIEEAGRSFADIRHRTERFRSVFYDSTLPHWMLDAITSQISTLRHRGILFRLAKGDVYGWEGSNGCCDPTCTHVWGYEQTLARLFPDLERDMRRIDYKHQQRADGGINNRTQFPSPPHPTGEQPFTDGHASCVLKAYREGMNHPDDSWLKEYWPGIRKAVEYLIGRDAATSGGDPNGLLEDDQWNTYDEALHGVTSFIGTYYLAALRAGEDLAHRFGDHEFGNKCRQIFLDGQRNLIEKCWNGEYFQQNLPGYEKMWGEVGPGCMSDQLIGQWWAHQLGLGYVLPPDLVRKALASVYKYNFKPDLTGWKHSPRAFAGNGDKGLIICTWPKGGRPDNVMLYSDEVWTGIEYQVAAHMAYEGMIDESIAIVRGLRERYDGRPRAPIPRNPWNEIECGGHYARAMSSWSMLLALSGYEYDGPAGHLRFTPRHTPDNFKSFFAGPEGWGTLHQTRKGGAQTNQITVTEGRIRVARLHLDSTAKSSQVTLDGKVVAAKLRPVAEGIEVALPAPLALAAGQTLAVTLT
jgi:uncharacterized protein (DUF608 family)